MGFSSTDDLVAEISANGNYWRTDYLVNLHNIGTVVAGRWYDMTNFMGNPVQYMHGNMLRNGDFMATQDPWTNTGTWAYVPASHYMSHGATSDGSVLTQLTKCIPGEKYTLIWTKGAGAGAVMPSLGGTNGTSRTTAATLYREDIICGVTAGAPLSFTTTDGTASIVDLVWLMKSAEFFPYTSESEHAMYIGPTPDNGETKHLINMSAFNNALLGSPSILELVDIVGVYPCVKTNQIWKQCLKHSTRLRNGLFIGATTGWTCGANWAYAGTNTCARAQAENVETLSQTGLDILAGVPYRVEFTMASSSGVGTITPSLGGVNGTPRTANGTYVETITPTATGGSLVFTPTNNDIATSILDVSVCPLVPRYTDGSGLRFFAVTSPDTPPGTTAQNMTAEYRNTATMPTATLVDGMNTADWTDGTNMTTTVNTTTYLSGTGALNLTKDSMTTALTYTSKATTSVNMTGKKLRLQYYCNTNASYLKLAAANALRIRFGSDSSNYYSWDFANTALLGQSLNGTGWTQIECSLLAYTAKTGTPDLAAMDYTYIGLTASDGTTITWAAGEFIIDVLEIIAEPSFLGGTVSNTASSIAGHILHSGAAAGNIGPFLPMAAGDSGVRAVEAITFTAASTAAGSVCIVVCKPLASIPLPYGFVAAERDFMSQLPSLPQVKDGACLGFIVYLGAISVAGTQFAGHLDLAWG